MQVRFPHLSTHGDGLLPVLQPGSGAGCCSHFLLFVLGASSVQLSLGEPELFADAGRAVAHTAAKILPADASSAITSSGGVPRDSILGDAGLGAEQHTDMLTKDMLNIIKVQDPINTDWESVRTTDIQEVTPHFSINPGEQRVQPAQLAPGTLAIMQNGSLQAQHSSPGIIGL